MRIAAYRRKKELGVILPFENLSAAGNQTSLQVVEAKSLYTTSAEEREMVCFFIFHDTGELPKNMQKPIIDFLVSGHEPQSESEKASNWREDEEEKNKPCPGLDLR